VTVRLSARRQTATARAGHAAGSCPPHPAEDTNLDRQPGEYDAPSSRVLPGPGLVSTHQPPVPATRRPAVHREPTPPRARATPRPSRTRAVGRHAPRICRAERHLTCGVAGPGTCPHAPVLSRNLHPPDAPGAAAPRAGDIARAAAQARAPGAPVRVPSVRRRFGSKAALAEAVIHSLRVAGLPATAGPPRALANLQNFHRNLLRNNAMAPRNTAGRRAPSSRTARGLPHPPGRAPPRPAPPSAGGWHQGRRAAAIGRPGRPDHHAHRLFLRATSSAPTCPLTGPSGHSTQSGQTTCDHR